MAQRGFLLGLLLEVGGHLGHLRLFLRGELVGALPEELPLQLRQFQQGFLELRLQSRFERQFGLELLLQFPVAGAQPRQLG